MPRGRPPQPVHVEPHDTLLLREVAVDPHWSERTARRAAIILGLAEGEAPGRLAGKVGVCDRTLRRCRRLWEREGWLGLIRVGRSTGRPRKQRQQVGSRLASAAGAASI